eukprot:6490744-Amphidinium_carterae.2
MAPPEPRPMTHDVGFHMSHKALGATDRLGGASQPKVAHGTPEPLDFQNQGGRQGVNIAANKTNRQYVKLLVSNSPTYLHLPSLGVGVLLYVKLLLVLPHNLRLLSNGFRSRGNDTIKAPTSSNNPWIYYPRCKAECCCTCHSQTPSTSPRESQGAKPNGTKKDPCKLWASTGSCRFGEKCKFSHDTPALVAETTDEEFVMIVALLDAVDGADAYPNPGKMDTITRSAGWLKSDQRGGEADADGGMIMGSVAHSAIDQTYMVATLAMPATSSVRTCSTTFDWKIVPVQK